MSDKISEVKGLIQQAIDENTRTVHGTSCGCDVDFRTCDVCNKACDEDLSGHDEGCFVGWLQEALSILDDVPPNAK